MTDFFTLAGVGARRGALRVGAGAVVPALTVTGDVLGPTGRELRGNEPLGEVRVGLRSTGRRWVRAEAVAGYRTFSPSAGVRVTAGMDW